MGRVELWEGGVVGGWSCGRVELWKGGVGVGGWSCGEGGNGEGKMKMGSRLEMEG